MEQYLSVKNVAKYFGKFQALNNINFDVNEGEFVCICLLYTSDAADES